MTCKQRIVDLCTHQFKKGNRDLKFLVIKKVRKQVGDQKMNSSIHGQGETALLKTL